MEQFTSISTDPIRTEGIDKLPGHLRMQARKAAWSRHKPGQSRTTYDLDTLNAARELVKRNQT